MKKFLIIIVITLSGNFLYGQSHSDLLKRMNEIKRMKDAYLWNQATFPDGDTAKVNAFKWLLLEVNGSRDESEQLSLADIEPYAKYIKINRGNLEQYFVYIKREDIGVKQGSRQIAQRQATEEQVTQSVKPMRRAFVPDAFIQKLLQQKNFYPVYNFLKSQKAQGNVLQFGALKDVDDYSSFELVLFDMQSKEIISVLSSEVSSGVRTNLMTGAQDSMDNYPEDMVLVIWYIK